MSTDPKAVAVHHGSADVVVSNKPVLIHWITVSNKSSHARRSSIYDGESTASPMKFQLVAQQGCNAIFCPVTPVYLSSGLYMTVEDTGLYVSIGYEIVS